MQVSAKDILLLQELTSEEAGRISKYATLIEKKEGEPILVSHDQVPGVYTILQGTVGVYINNNKLLTVLSSGESFGEMSYLEKTPASATLRALSDVAKIALLSNEAFEEIAGSEPEISIKIHKGIARSLSRKLRKTNNKINDALAEISSEIEVSNVQTSLSANYKKLRDAILGVGNKLRELDDLYKDHKDKNESISPNKLKTKLLVIGDDMDTLMDRVALMGKNVDHLDDAARKLNEVRQFFFGKDTK